MSTPDPPSIDWEKTAERLGITLLPWQLECLKHFEQHRHDHSVYIAHPRKSGRTTMLKVWNEGIKGMHLDCVIVDETTGLEDR